MPPRRPFDLGMASASALLLAACGGAGDGAPTGSAAPTAPTAPTNGRLDVVLVVIDTLRADHVGVYGCERDTTPALDALARDGVWFRRAYAHSGWTLPSVASLLTGLFPHQHRAGRHPTETARFGRLAPRFETLAELVETSGYRTGAVVNNTFLAPELGLGQGFGADYDWVGADNARRRSARETVERGLAWLDAGDGRPSFLLLHFMEPHLDYDPPDEVRGAFTGPEPAPVPMPLTTDAWLDSFAPDRSSVSDAELAYVVALYDEEILAADRALGRLVDGLRARERLGRTLLAVTADHGEEFFDHGSFEHGHTLFGELTRVPLVLHGPGLAGGERGVLVQQVDLFQGLVAATGARRPPGTSGVDLVALARGEIDPGPRASLSENTLYGAPLASLVDDESRLLLDLSTGRVELWELGPDGVETGAGPDRSEARAEHLRELCRALAELRGGEAPTELEDGGLELDPEAWEQLEALGYVGGGRSAGTER